MNSQMTAIQQLLKLKVDHNVIRDLNPPIFDIFLKNNPFALKQRELREFIEEYFPEYVPDDDYRDPIENIETRLKDLKKVAKEANVPNFIFTIETEEKNWDFENEDYDAEDIWCFYDNIVKICLSFFFN